MRPGSMQAILLGRTIESASSAKRLRFAKLPRQAKRLRFAKLSPPPKTASFCKNDASETTTQNRDDRVRIAEPDFYLDF
jgi:hypothetical protein